MSSITELGALVWELYGANKLTRQQLDNIFEIIENN